MNGSSDVLIIGGGIQGCALAFHLVRSGASVRVLEKDYPGRHASGVNAGGVRTLGRHPAELPLSLIAKRCWKELADLLDADVGFSPVGQLRIAENEGELEKLRQRRDLVSGLGLDYREEIIEADDLHRMVPALSPHCIGALYVADDGHASPFRTTTAYRLAAERLGACFERGAEVVSVTADHDCFHVRLRDGRSFGANRLVNCAGAWGGRIAALVGDDIALEPNGSMLMVTMRMPAFLGPVVGAAGRSLSFKQFANGSVLIGGGHRAPVDIDRNGTSIDLMGLAKAAQNATALFPRMKNAKALRFWSGIEGFTSDHLPVIGPSASQAGAFHAFGFSAHGFQLAPAVGLVLSQAILGGATACDLSAFRVDRESIRGSVSGEASIPSKPSSVKLFLNALDRHTQKPSTGPR